LQIKTKIVSCHTVKQKVNSTVILPPLVFLALTVEHKLSIFLSFFKPEEGVDHLIPFIILAPEDKICETAGG
jgi:hypothetical protein